MTDFRTAGSIGERIQAARKARGMSARQLAEAIGGSPSQSTIENIELGRKAAIDVVQLLNIAMALRLPMSYLLAPVGRPLSRLDLVGLSDAFGSMTVLEFDAWLAGSSTGEHLPTSLEERNAISELQALRDWHAGAREEKRLLSALEFERDLLDSRPPEDLRSVEIRLLEAQKARERLATFLRSAGWDLP